MRATFTTRDLAMFVHRHSEGKDQFDQIMGAVQSPPELVKLDKDGRGNERSTSRDMIATEQRLERASVDLEARRHHGVSHARAGPGGYARQGAFARTAQCLRPRDWRVRAYQRRWLCRLKALCAQVVCSRPRQGLRWAPRPVQTPIFIFDLPHESIFGVRAVDAKW